MSDGDSYRLPPIWSLNLGHSTNTNTARNHDMHINSSAFHHLPQRAYDDNKESIAVGNGTTNGAGNSNEFGRRVSHGTNSSEFLFNAGARSSAFHERYRSTDVINHGVCTGRRYSESILNSARRRDSEEEIMVNGGEESVMSGENKRQRREFWDTVLSPSKVDSNQTEDVYRRRRHEISRGMESPSSESGGKWCQQCDLMFESLRLLQLHCSQVHSASTAQRIQQQQETEDEEDDEETECEKCGKHVRQLAKHMKKEHSEGKPYKCKECSLRFVQKSALKSHVRIVHEKERPFVCELCDSTFGHKGDLNRHHMIKHQKLRPFKCQICGAAFGRKSVLLRHKEKLHPT
mmetsp:Transcript_7069/g.12678  ORF Transcript_7069/g.12678 Transcript_7069/m.12678 type:complete len:347 (-) Transcript_7069:374-1414(-)